MSKIEEKIKLAEEFGMKSWVGEARRVQEEMGLKFEKTTPEEINKTLSRMVIQAHWKSLIFTPLTIVSIFLGTALLLAAFLFKFMPAIGIAIFGIGFILFAQIKCMPFQFGIEHEKLEDWKHDMPYGAMLAVKEAKEQGIVDFLVWFPSRKADPIITGITQYGNLVQIYAWDDRIIHE